eukprot:4940829-Karenia_brevis.AAC.1
MCLYQFPDGILGAMSPDRQSAANWFEMVSTSLISSLISLRSSLPNSVTIALDLFSASCKNTPSRAGGSHFGCAGDCAQPPSPTVRPSHQPPPPCRSPWTFA